jgi:hypothetical protein
MIKEFPSLTNGVLSFNNDLPQSGAILQQELYSFLMLRAR